jgi:chorismate lyase / 3-hydroxybenzoate synthase
MLKLGNLFSMTRISLEYLEDGMAVGAQEHVLGVLTLSGTADSDLSVGLTPLKTKSGAREVWRAEKPVTKRGMRHNVRLAQTEGLVFGMLQQILPENRTEEEAKAAYDAMLDVIEEVGCPHLVRISNYIPDITSSENGQERYRAFNAGRQAAFSGRSRTSTHAPAACGLGCHGDALRLFFLASEEPGRNIENPRQVSAFNYPKQYGPKAPLFARATVAAGMLLISGTSSIVGHETVHVGNVAAQADETLRNIDALLAEAAKIGSTVTRRDLRLKVYLRHARDVPVAEERIRAGGFDTPVAWLQSEVCRPELDIEIEAHTRCSI